MVQLGKSFVMIMEPEGFNINGDLFHHKELGFVVGSESEWFRNSIFTMAKQAIGVWQQHYSPAILSVIQEYIGSFLHSRVKREEVILPFIGGLGILAYYISVNQHKQVHLKSFMAINSDLSKPMFYCYVGTKNHTSTDVIAKLMTKINQSQQGVGNQEGSCSELAQVPIR